MKLKKLQIKNIASIEDACVDFEAKPLSGSNVILITGDTGAGKSTLLDAICLALYATTPRLKNTKMEGTWQENQNDSIDVKDTMQLMRKNTDEAYARLSFLGSDGNEYIAEWHVERKKKNLSRVWSLQNLSHPEASPQNGNGVGGSKDNEIKQAIQAAVGLDFDQFCRTTMLAQGDFTRFLMSGKKEKAAILEKITNTEQYAQIGAKVYELTYKRYKEEMEKVDPAKQGQQPLKDDDRKELVERIKNIENQLISLNSQLETAQKKEQWLLMEKTLLDNKAKAYSSVVQIKAAMETESFKLAQKNVTDWDSTSDARTWLTAIQNAKKTIASADQTIQGLQRQYTTLLNGKEFILQEINSLWEQIEEIDKEIKAEGSMPLSFEELNMQKDNVLGLIRHIDIAKLRVDTYLSKTKERTEKQTKLTGQKAEIDKKHKELEELKPALELAEKQYKEFEQEYERLNLAVDTLAEKLRSNLQINHRCPICGQAVKSLDTVPHEQDLQAIVAEANRKRDKAKKTFDDLNGQQNQYAVWLNQNERSYQNDLESFHKDQSLNEAQNEALLSLEKCHIKQLDEHSFENLEQAKKKAETQIKSLVEKMNRAKLREDLQRKYDDLKNNKAGVLASSLKQLIEKLPEWESIDPQKAEKLPDILNAMQILSNNVTAALTSKGTATDNLQTNRDSLDNYLGVHPEMTEPRLEQLIALKDRIEQQRQSVEHANKSLANAQGALETLNGQLESHTQIKPAITEGETIESLQNTIEELKNQITPLGREFGAAEQQLSDDDKVIEKQVELKKEYEKRKAVFERWNKLNTLIGDAKGERFRLIAQSYILANLVNAANIHMRTLTDRYILHTLPGQDLIILVEDAYQGGALRPASTISGGESFLVSLALALALSEIGQSLKVETLFIDEGFGTLSGEPLLKAIDTLESLHDSNNRQVCAISHREEVKDRIPVQIQINRNPQSSISTVHVVPTFQMKS